MAMKYELIQAPSRSARALIQRRMAHGPAAEGANWGSVLLVQGMVVEIMAAADIGSKAADVAVTAMARSPRVSWATLSKKVESTPAEKATATLPISSSACCNCFSFSAT